MPEQFLTCAFRLREPTERKRVILDRAIQTYTDAVAQVLTWCEENLATIQADGRMMRKDKATDTLVPMDKYNAMSVSKAVPSSGTWSFDLAGNLKEAAVMDACSMVASYLELCKLDDRESSFPTAFEEVKDHRGEALECLRLLADDLGLENELRDQLHRRSKVPLRPITFLRKRDFSILVNESLDKFMLAFRPLPDTSTAIDRITFDGKLFDIETGESVKGRSKAILLPLEIGKRNGAFAWQFRKFLAAAMQGKASIKAAKLIPLSDGRHTLNVSFAFDCAEPYKPVSYLGVSKSVLKYLTYAVVDLRGEVLALESSPTGLEAVKVAANAKIAERQRKAQQVSLRDYRGQAQENVLHNIANYMIEVAQFRKAAIVVESTETMQGVQLGSDKLAAPWRKLVFILQYKSALAGVPFVGERFGANAASICPVCGTGAKYIKSRFQFICPTCDSSFYPTESSSINIARRALYRKAEWDERGGYLGFHFSFANHVGVLSER